MAADRYPSPSAAQGHGGNGPFYGQPPDESMQHGIIDADRGYARDHQAQQDAVFGLANNGAPDDSLANHEEIAQQVMSMSSDVQRAAEEAAAGDDTLKAKRSKISRACDECRRKKIRCDAAEDQPTGPCSNCRRTHSECKFSRQPMKRGPSKGYIKELADKISTLETRLGPGSFEFSEVYTPGDLGREYPAGRKRTHSMSERLYEPYREGYTDYQERTLQTPDRQPRTWKPEGEFEDGAALAWDETIVDDFYRIVQPTLPILPQSKQRMRQRVAECPPALRQAFLVSLSLCTSSLLGRREQPTLHWPALLARYQAEGPRSFQSDLVHVQTLCILALADEGPEQRFPRSEIIGSAIGAANNLRLHAMRPARERDEDECIGRRLWWSLFVIDRWHACATAALAQMPDGGYELEPSDRALLGDATYGLVRLSHIVHHVGLVLAEPRRLFAQRAGFILAKTLQGEVSRFRESADGLLAPQAAPATALVHLAYNHVRLLVAALTFTASAAPTPSLPDLLAPAEQTVAVLAASPNPSPLQHHFAALAGLVLSRLAAFDETRAPAERALAELRAFAGRPDAPAWHAAIGEYLAAQASRTTNGYEGSSGVGGLHHLADASMLAANGAGDDDEGPGLGFDPAGAVRRGYLTAVAAGPAGAGDATARSER